MSSEHQNGIVTGNGARTGQTLRASELSYRLLFEAAKDGILILDVDTGRIADVNPFLIKLLGLSQGEMAGKTIGELGVFNGSISDRAMLERLQKDGDVHYEDLSLETRDGRKIAVELVGNVYQNGDRKMIQCRIHEVSECRRLEEALRKSEERYRGLFEHMVEGFAYCRMIFENGEPKDWIYLSVNHAFENLTGLKGVAGKRISEVIPRLAETDPELFKIYARVSLTGKAEQFEMFVQSLQQWFAVSVYSPEKEFFVAVFDVITDRKRVEAAARESERRFQTLADTSPVGIFRTDAQGQTTYVNPRWCEISGLSATEALDDGWLRAVHPDDRERLVQGWQAATEAQSISKTDYRFVHPDGTISWVMGQAVPEKDHAGHVVGFVGTITDITERKRAEEEIQTILRTTMDGFYLVDTDGRFLDTNDAYCRMIGYSREEMLTMAVKDVEALETNEQIKERIQQIKKKGHVRFETKHRRKDGTIIDIEASCNFLTHEKKVLFVFMRDITKRKQVERALRESENRFRTLIEEAPVAVSISRAGKTIYVNRKYLELYRFQRVEEVAGQPVSDQWAPEFREIIEARARQRACGEPVPSEYEGIGQRKDGSQFQVHIVVAAVNLPDGPASLAFLTDVTERERAEAALRDSEAFLNTVIENIPHMIFVKDAKELRFLKFNQAGQELLGYSLADLAGKNDYDFFPKKLADHFTENDRRVLRGRKVVDISEEPVQTRDKGVRILHTKKIPLFDNAGQALYLLGISEDITEHKRAEEFQARLATAVEQAAETIVITDTNGTIVYANPAFERTSGYTRAEAIGQNPRLFKSGRHDSEFYRQLWEVLGRGEVWSGHFINRRKNGAFYEEEATISPVRDAAGTIVNYVAVKRDVTREVQLEAQFRQAQKMEAVGQLAGGVAHDFNNILGVIIGYGDLITADLDPDSPLRKYAEEIRQAAERAAGLTRQLLVFSRKQKMEPVVLDLNDAVKELEKMLRRLIGENIEMMIVPGKEIARIKADTGHIGQVLMNLVVNARDAMPNGGKLTIATGNVTLDENYTRAHPGINPGDYVMLSVSDTGIGMTPEIKARMFEALFTTKPAGKGTGLGLATCQTIVQQSGGHIDVDSEVGKGATFRIYFPQVDTPLETAAGPEQSGPLPRGTETVLLVEDEPTVRHLAWKVLEGLGYHMLRATNGQDALHLAREHQGAPIRLVVTDVIMPRMGGKVMADWLKTTYPDLKILFTSGYTDDALAQQGVLEPGVAFLPKPFTPAILARKVRAMLDNETDTSILRNSGATINQSSPGSP